MIALSIRLSLIPVNCLEQSFNKFFRIYLFFGPPAVVGRVL